VSRPERDVSADIAFFLTASAILEDAELRHRGRERPRALADSLEDEDGDERADRTTGLVSDDVIEDAFLERGEEEIAGLYRNDRREFWSRFERGRDALMRPRPSDERPRMAED
jgi:hypothetical protein